ncbi:MAG: glycosyltransferase family 2 protein [Chitinophagaceae bacterium]|nr:glycosyltransferase family 2 protein [Chitinophagaceae bacterium]
MLNTLTVIVPVYNEEQSIVTILSRIQKVQLLNDISKEIIIVDDGSTDRTHEMIASFIETNEDAVVQYHRLEKNGGKGTAVRKGIELATGEYLIIQDADLEYDPEEYNVLLATVLKADADLVLGSRFVGGKPHRILFFWHSIGNHILTRLSNMFTNLNLTDIETGYKMIRTSIIKKIVLRENRFGFEPEVIAKLARIRGIKIYEVGISYYGRTYEEGKKINWKDGFRAIYCILKYNLFR